MQELSLGETMVEWHVTIRRIKVKGSTKLFKFILRGACVPNVMRYFAQNHKCRPYGVASEKCNKGTKFTSEVRD